MKRGDLVTVALAGDYGKPRPALIVQDDAFADHVSVTMLLLSSDIQDSPLMRVTVMPGETNGLRLPSQVMIDKAMTVPRDRIGPRIGQLTLALLEAVDIALSRFLGLARR